MEKKLCKRLFSMMLVLAMVLSMCPTFVFAEGTTDYSDYTYVAFGDSIVYGADGDTGSRMEKPYVSLVGEALGIGNVINLARSGSTWTECPPRVNMAQRAIKYNGKADIISVGLGTNDYAAKKALGDMNSRDNTTIYGSIHMVAESLTTKYPNAFIFFTTPVKYKTEDNGIFALSDVAQAIKDVAAVYNIPVLDLYNKFDWDPLTEVKDQIHPNQKHHTEQLAPLVTEFIRQHTEVTVSKDACPCATCDGADATWVSWDGTTAFENGKHYRLAADVQLTGVVTVAASTTVVLDLNGKTITAAADSRCFEVSGELSIINSTADKDADGNYTGLITGGKAAGSDAETQRGGNICVNASATLKMYGGTIANGFAPNAGGNVKLDDKAKFYMYGGSIVDGKSETSVTVGNGGNLVVDTGALFEMHGGTISGGTTSANGGNIYTWKGTITIYDGVITGGKANGATRGYGGNIWLNAANATLNMYGGEISDGVAAQHGGNLYVDNAKGKVNMYGGVISGGKATKHGGNIYVASGTVKMTGGVISDGKANWDAATSAHNTGSSDGGNLYLSAAKAYLGGNATVTGGSAGTATNQYGGNIYGTSAAAIYLQDQVQILGGDAIEGKNIYAMTDVTVTMYGGTVKNGNFKTGTSGSFHMYGGQVEDMIWSGSGTQETVIYNGILGSNSSGLPEKLEACKAACATVAQNTHVEGHTIYAVYQTNLTDGACATCGHTYSAANCGTCSTYSHPAVKVANCEFCDKDVVWAPLLGNELVADHYYLAEDVALTGKIGLTVDDGVCIDLNGHNLTTADVTTGITATSAKLNVTNTSAETAVLQSGGGGILAANKASGEARSVINFKNVTVSGGHSIDNGGNISVNAVDLTLDNCIIRDGYASKNGGNVCCYATNLIIKGNTQIVKGFAFNNGDDLYLGTTSKAQMYSGTVGDICQLSSTGSLHLYGGTVDKLLSYNYGSYNSKFYMYGGTVNSIGVAQPDKTMANGVMALYAGTVGNDPRIANYKDTTMVATCSCVIKNANGTYTIMHTGGTSTCENCAASDVYEGGYTYPAASTGEHTYSESWTEGKKVCENCGNTIICEHANTTLTGYQAATCLAPGYSGDYVCDECGITTAIGTDLEQKTHEYGDDHYCVNGCDKIKCEYNDCVPGTAVKENIDAPTCSEPGSHDEVVYCQICGEKLSSTTITDAATGHTYTYTDNGDKTHTIGCENCDYSDSADCTDENADKFCDDCGAKLLDPVAEVNGVEYGSLLDAWQHATPNSTIKLLADVDMTGVEGMYVPSSTLTLDLNGFTLKVPFQAIAFAGDNFTICNGTIDSLGASYGLWIGGNADAAVASNVTIEDVTVIGGINIKNATNVTLNNVTATGIGYYAVWVESNASGVVINSGSYTGAEGKAAVSAANADALTVKGGTYSSNVTTFCEEGKHTATEGGVYVYGDHDYTTVVTDPTCTDKGFTTYTCACGDSYTDDEVAATGHSHEAVYTPATNTENAYTTYTCACGDTYTEVEEGTVLHYAVNETTGESYASVQAALNAAAKGDTVKLLKDATEEDVYVGAQKTLDLNGHTLTAGSVNASYGTSHIIDSTNGDGLLVVDKAEIALNRNNKQLPLWSDEGARFVDVNFGEALSFVDKTGAANANVAYFRFAFNDKAAQTILDDYLANGSEDTCISIRIKATYTAASGTVTQYFDIPSSLVEQYINSGNGWDANMFKLYLTGVEGKEIHLTAEIISTANTEAVVVIEGDTLS